MEQLILSNGQMSFTNEVNRMLEQGWRVVPGTCYVTSYQEVASFSDRQISDRIKDGLIFHSVWCVVVRKDLE